MGLEPTTLCSIDATKLMRLPSWQHVTCVYNVHVYVYMYNVCTLVMIDSISGGTVKFPVGFENGQAAD